jgi:hypothetical protein
MELIFNGIKFNNANPIMKKSNSAIRTYGTKISIFIHMIMKRVLVLQVPLTLTLTFFILIRLP